MVPVVVSAGLAIGVFCGLLFGLGTKRDAVAEPPKASNGVKRTEDAIDPASLGSSTGSPSAKPGPVAGSNAVAAGSAGSGPASGTAAATEHVAPPAAETTKLIVEVKPDAAAQIAKLYVDGKEMSEMTTDIELPAGTTKKKVVVAIKAPGYKDAEQEVEVEGESTTLKLELARGPRPTVDSAIPAPSTTATPSPPPPSNTGTRPSGTKPSGTKPSGKKTGNGGLIDI
jgi:hypothetical protein